MKNRSSPRGRKSSYFSCALWWILALRVDLTLAGGEINWAPETFPGFLEPQHANNKCAGLGLRSRDDMVPISQSKCRKDLGDHALTRFRKRGLPTQEWFVEAVGPKAPYFRLRNNFSDKCMSVSLASTEDGAEIQQFSCDDKSEQLWDLQKSIDVFGAVSFQIVASHSGLCLQVASEVDSLEPCLKNNALLIQTSCRESIEGQRWVISGTGVNPTPSLPPAKKEVQPRPYFNMRTDLCATIRDDKSAWISHCSAYGGNFGRERPFFRIEIAGSYYRLVATDSSKCLFVASLASGNNEVVEKDCDATGDKQHWEFLVGADLFEWQSDHLKTLGAELQGTSGLVRLRNHANKRCLSAQTVSRPSAVTHRRCVVTYVAMLWMMTADRPVVLPDDFSLRSKLHRDPSNRRPFCAEIQGGRESPGARLKFKACTSDAAQSFPAIAAGGYYKLAADHTSLSSNPTCVAVRGGRDAIGVEGALIIQVKCRPRSKNQQWKVKKGGMANFVILENRLTEMCIGVSGGAAVPGVDLVQFSCDVGDDKLLWNTTGLL